MSSHLTRRYLVTWALLGGLAPACATGRPTRAFAETLVRDAREGSATTQKVALGAAVENLPPSCFSIGRQVFKCERAGGPPGAIVRVSREHQVESIVLWGQAGPSSFTCKLFRALEQDFRSLMGPPTEAYDSCSSCRPWGCNETGGASRTWQLGGSKLVLSEGGNLEALTAPDGTPVGEVAVRISNR